MATAASTNLTEETRQRALIVSDALQEEGFEVSGPFARDDAQLLVARTPVLSRTLIRGQPRLVSNMWGLADIAVMHDGLLLIDERTDLVVRPDGELLFELGEAYWTGHEPRPGRKPHSGHIVADALKQRGLGEWLRDARGMRIR